MPPGCRRSCPLVPEEFFWGAAATSTFYSSRSRCARRAQKQRRCTMLLEFWALLPHNTSDLTPGVNHLCVENKDRRPEVVFSSSQSGGKPSPRTKHQNGQTCGASFFIFYFPKASLLQPWRNYLSEIFPVLHIPACGRLVGLMQTGDSSHWSRRRERLRCGKANLWI